MTCFSLFKREKIKCKKMRHEPFPNLAKQFNQVETINRKRGWAKNRDKETTAKHSGERKREVDRPKVVWLLDNQPHLSVS